VGWNLYAGKQGIVASDTTPTNFLDGGLSSSKQFDHNDEIKSSVSSSCGEV
jgi:hypothetical protein